MHLEGGDRGFPREPNLMEEGVWSREGAAGPTGKTTPS